MLLHTPLRSHMTILSLPLAPSRLRLERWPSRDGKALPAGAGDSSVAAAEGELVWLANKRGEEPPCNS